MKVKEFIKQAVSELSALYPEAEARNIVQILLCETLNVSSWKLALMQDEEIDSNSTLFQFIARLKRFEPLQYVLGYSDFYGYRFKVTPDVLIPRPETEVLVRWVLEECGISAECSKDAGGDARGYSVLDLCTGSGAIAWSLALSRKDWNVVGVDISEAALEVARSQHIFVLGENNAPTLGEINLPIFIKGDVLALDFLRSLEPVDILVSNPPYIMESEKVSMRSNVLDYEPSLALFVPDDNALIFYKAIAETATFLLKPSGIGIVEINDLLAKQTLELFISAGLNDVELVRDLHGRNRFVRFKR